MPQKHHNLDRPAPGCGGAGANTQRPATRKRAIPTPYRIVIISLLLAAVLTGTAAAYTTPETIEAASNVYVSDVTFSPGTFFPGDEGTITIEVTNGNIDTGVVVSHATLYDDEHVFVVTSSPFSTSASIGPGQTQAFTFGVTADTIAEGTFYPIFSISFRDADSLWYRTTVRVEDAPLELTITERPDTFTEGGKKTVTVLVWNPRESAVRSVTIVPSGSGISTTPLKGYVGDLGAGESKEVTFEVTPAEETTLLFTAEYYNGVNEHEVVASIPVTFGHDKTGAEIVVNNIESSGSAGSMTIKGDVTNNGLTDAKSVIVTVGSPATPVNPNPVYAIGNLEPDDFSSFEVTYTTTGTPSLPLIVEYKDSDGNLFTETFSINTGSNAVTGASGAVQGAPMTEQAATGQRRNGGMFGSFGSGMNQVPVTGIALALIALVALAVAWRKGYVKPVIDRFRKKPVDDDEFIVQER